jgi:hypothetical protein
MSASEVNPFKPGAGHPPPYLAGRDQEIAVFKEHLKQNEILNNVVLTGLRGTGKTVLMDNRYKPEAQKAGWVWVGSDFSESSFLSEEHLCIRLFTDLSVFTSGLRIPSDRGGFGFSAGQESDFLSYEKLMSFYDEQPGLSVDKLKATMGLVWAVTQAKGIRGIVFAYDEAQLVTDQKESQQYPLANLLESFQSLQKKGVRFILLLTGLPTLFSRLVESRTYAERMFTVQELGRLSDEDSRKAIEVPVRNSRWKFTECGVQKIIDVTDGYPYFIQFICRETFDHLKSNPDDTDIPIQSITRKLDSDFFAGRWEHLTDRQRELLYCIAQLPVPDNEFAISDVVDKSAELDMKKFTPGDISQILPRLIEKGLLFKNRHGKYSFAVPLFSRFILRKLEGRLRQAKLFEQKP